MKLNIKIMHLPILIIGILITLSQGCKSDETTPAPNGPNPPATVTDNEGNIYHTVVIGTQAWMTEDLKVTKYRNGDPITNITDNTSWASRTTEAYCNYNNDATLAATYGKLYNWYAVTDSRNIAPIGWHVPTDEEWKTLTTFLGGEAIAGNKLKEAGTVHWKTLNEETTNESGFTALPNGSRIADGTFYRIYYNGNWWTTTSYSSTNAWRRYLNYNETKTNRDNPYKKVGQAVRCIMD